MENKVKIPIFIPDEEARKFIVFKKYYDTFSLMIEKNVFETKNGSISLHFDRNGILQSIQRSDILYSKRFE